MVASNCTVPHLGFEGEPQLTTAKGGEPSSELAKELLTSG